jgi:DNA-binding GntR family transcriptional regulator
MNSAVSLVNHLGLGEKVYQLLKDQILTAHLTPGQPLSIVDLATRLGVSRTPVKDALSRLSVEGLIEEVPRRGYFVARLDAQEVAELLEVRLILELAAAERGVAVVQPEQIAALWRLHESMAAMVEADGRYKDYAAFRQADRDLHVLAVGLANNRRLSEMHLNLFVHSEMHRAHFATAASHRRGALTLNEHAAIIQAIEARDLTTLKAAITVHVQEANRWFQAVFEELRQQGTAHPE